MVISIVAIIVVIVVVTVCWLSIMGWFSVYYTEEKKREKKRTNYSIGKNRGDSSKSTMKTRCLFRTYNITKSRWFFPCLFILHDRKINFKSSFNFNRRSFSRDNLFWTMSNFFLRSSNKRNWIFCLLADDFSLSMSMSAAMVLVLLAEILIDHLVALSHSVSLKSSWKKRAAMWFKRFKTCVRLDRM